jgi:hypothetical protein
MRTKKVQTVALAALTVLAGACSSSHSAAKPVAAPSGGGTTSLTGSAAPPSDSAAPTSPASSPAAPASSSAKALTADQLQKALLTGTDLPGYRTGPLAPASASSAPPSRDCAKVLGSIGSLTEAKGNDVAAGETLQGDAGPGQAASIFVRLQAAPNADDAGAAVTDLRQGLASCKIVKGGAPITALPVTGIGDDAAAFTMDLGTGLVGGTAFLTARVGTVTMTIEAVGTGSGSPGLPELSAQLKAVGAKEVAKVRAALAG